MPPRSPATISLPPFRGAVRQLVVVLVAAFFAVALIGYVSRPAAAFLAAAMLLEPRAVMHGWIWQLATYPFLNTGILNTAFALLTLWFTGSMLEESRGRRWFLELFYASAAGGGLFACLLGALPLLSGGRVGFPGISPIAAAAGVSPPLFGVLVAFAMLFGDVEFLLFFVLRMKAKYMVILGALLYLATLLHDRNNFAALLTLCCGVCGLLYARLAGRNGVAAVFSERYYEAKNQWVRSKRRRAARKFEVYMRKQDRIVKFDSEGRYIEPDDERRTPRDSGWKN